MKKRVQLCLDRYLDQHGISRYALAKAADVGYPIIDRYYKNRVSRYDREILSRIVTALNCDIKDIFTVSEEK